MSENKTGKYLKYAIGEILLVMVGILLALQVNNWKDQYLTKKQEEKTIGLLIRDLELDYRDLAIYSSKLKDSEDNMKRLLVEIYNNQDQDSLAEYIGPALSLWNYRPSYPTYQSLIQNSNLDIISDDTIRDEIIAYFDGTVTYLDDLRGTYKDMNRSAKEAVKPYFGYELDQDNKWSYTSINSINELKKDIKTVHTLTLLGNRNYGLARRIDNLFLRRNKDAENLLRSYLSKISK